MAAAVKRDVRNTRVQVGGKIRPGANGGGRPRGDRFKEIAADLQAMASGAARAVLQPERPASAETPKEPPKVNVPLKDSDNERAGQLVNLDEKFTLDVAAMPPAASTYFRRRPFLSLEVCRKWRAGYLPRDTGGDHLGGTMRGKVVSGYPSESGDLLTWFGRDSEFEGKHEKWVAGGKVEKEPEKFYFVKGFHRGLELFGQHALQSPDVPSKLAGLGLVLVEGSNDVIRLDTLGIPAVALCSNAITREQAAKAAQLARRAAGSIVTVFLDCDPDGETGMKQALGYLAQLVPVRLAWTSKMYGGKFKGRQPESLSVDQWVAIREYLTEAKAVGWSLV